MSDVNISSSQGESTAESNNSGQGESTATNVNPIAQALSTPEQVQLSELANGILKDADENIRPQLVPFLNKWDAGFKEQVEKVKSQYKEYEGLDAVTAREAVELQTLLFENPQAAIELIRQQSGLTETQPEPEQEFNDVLDNLPVEIRDRLKKVDDLEAIVSALADKEIQLKQAAEEKQLVEEYDALLTTLETKHGKFDKEIVNAYIAVGTAPEEAVVKYHALANKLVEEKMAAHNAAPPVLGGSGGIAPTDTQPVSKLSDKDRRSFVAKMLLAQQSETE